MTGRVEDWREERQDRRIDCLESDLRDAREKIRELERRPMEWLLKAEMALMWILVLAIWVMVVVEIADKH